AADMGALEKAGVVDGGRDGATDADLAQAIANRLASWATPEALARLNAAGVPAVAARMPGDLTEDPRLCNLGMFTTLHMHDGTPFFVANRYARFSRTQEEQSFTPPGLGEHSREVLLESGVS